MNAEKVKKAYMPMTETAFYILLSLSEPRHGYGIIKFVEELTEGRIKLGSGTVYGTLSKMQKENIITIYADDQRKTIYEITPIGKELIRAEIARIGKLYANAKALEVNFHG
ncbi:MAG: PadR family transcriptional regulator [Dethiobacteria bacterium]|jgi:DNA-binding PadR family transcriptional regulator